MQGTHVPHTSELITEYRRQGVPALWGTHVTYTPGLIKECRQVVADLKTAILNVYETSVEQHNTSHAKAKTNISKMCDGTALRIEQELLALIDNLRLPSAWEPSSNAS